jgi:hypothetical protein
MIHLHVDRTALESRSPARIELFGKLMRADGMDCNAAYSDKWGASINCVASTVRLRYSSTGDGDFDAL